jgi:hypothetical protein
MAARKIRDIAVRTGQFTDPASGAGRGRFQNVGALMQGEDGQMFILLQRWFNPAGIASDRETILLSCFEERAPARKADAGSRGVAQGEDDDIPF